MTRARTLLLSLMLASSAGACTLLQTEHPAERDAASRLALGLAATDAGRYREAFDHLAWVYSHCPGREAAYQATIGLAALELDPRNPVGRPAIGTQMLAEAMQRPGAPEWARPLLESGYLMALGLGASAAPAQVAEEGGDDGMAPPDTPAMPGTRGAAAEPATATVVLDRESQQPVHGCGRSVPVDGWVPPRLPELPGPSLAGLLTQTEAERDALVVRTDTLTQELAVARQQLEETRAELERIRKTLKP